MKKTFFLKTPYITLGQLLKVESVVQTGGQAKWYLKDHVVEVNKQLDTRRGRKLYAGDNVEVPAVGLFFIRKK